MRWQVEYTTIYTDMEVCISVTPAYMRRLSCGYGLISSVAPEQNCESDNAMVERGRLKFLPRARLKLRVQKVRL